MMSLAGRAPAFDTAKTSRRPSMLNQMLAATTSFLREMMI